MKNRNCKGHNRQQQRPGRSRVTHLTAPDDSPFETSDSSELLPTLFDSSTQLSNSGSRQSGALSRSGRGRDVELAAGLASHAISTRERVDAERQFTKRHGRECRDIVQIEADRQVTRRHGITARTERGDRIERMAANEPCAANRRLLYELAFGSGSNADDDWSRG